MKGIGLDWTITFSFTSCKLWTMFCREPWVLAFMWMLLCTTYLNNVANQVLHGNVFLMAVVSFSRMMCSGALQKLFGNDLRNMTKRSKYWLTIPHATAQLQRSYGVHASKGQSCFGSTKSTYEILSCYFQCYSCFMLININLLLLHNCQSCCSNNQHILFSWYKLGY